MPQPTTRPLPTLLQKTLPLLAALATLGFAAARPASGEPPAFERRDGSAVDGQTIVQPTQPRRQVVAILPDRTTGRDWGLRYLREAVDDLNRMRPDAVFAVGDLVQGYSRDRAQVARWHEEYLAIIGRLTMPFYPTAGNHDLVSGGRDPKDRSFVDAYRRLFGPLHYAVELELASVVVLNTEDGGGEVQAGLSDSSCSGSRRPSRDSRRAGGRSCS